MLAYHAAGLCVVGEHAVYRGPDFRVEPHVNDRDFQAVRDIHEFRCRLCEDAVVWQVCGIGRFEVLCRERGEYALKAAVLPAVIPDAVVELLVL